MSIEAVALAFKQPISPSAKKFVLVALADNADTYGICFPSYRHIMKKTSLTRAAVIRNCAALVKEGVIEKAGRIRGDGSDTSNAYRLPIVEGCIDDHPLSPLFKSEGVYEIDPPVYEKHPGVSESDPGGVPDAPREASSNHHLTEKIKKPLARDEFLRVINGAYHKGAFDDFKLEESTVAIEANNVWDHWSAKGEWPGGDPVSVARNWIRNGLSKNKIRREPKDRGSASEGCERKEPSNPVQPWHERIRSKVGEAVFRSWIRPLHWNGNGTLQAPTKFHADWVSNHYRDEIADVLPNVAILHQPYQPTEEKEASHA